MSLPAILTLALEPENEYLTVEKIHFALNEAKEQLVYVNEFAASRLEDDEDDE